MVDTSREVIRCLENLGYPHAPAVDVWLVPLLREKLDIATAFAWDQSVDENKIPSVEEFLNFLQKWARSARPAAPKTQRNQAAPTPSTSRPTSQTCPECSTSHYLTQYPTFLKTTIEERSAIQKRLHLCANCLQPNKTTALCSSSTCRKCMRKHHTMLHRDSPTNVSACPFQ